MAWKPSLCNKVLSQLTLLCPVLFLFFSFLIFKLQKGVKSVFFPMSVLENLFSFPLFTVITLWHLERGVLFYLWKKGVKLGFQNFGEVMSGIRRVLKSIQAVAAHGLLFCFTLLLVLKLDQALHYPWWYVFTFASIYFLYYSAFLGIFWVFKLLNSRNLEAFWLMILVISYFVTNL